MTARIVFATDVVRVGFDALFTFSFGWASPDDVECQRAIALPDLRQTLMALAAAASQTSASNSSAGTAALRR